MSAEHLVKHGNNLVCVLWKAMQVGIKQKSTHCARRCLGGMCRSVCASVYLCGVNLGDPPVLRLCGGVLDPGLHQDALILALLVQPLMALKDVPDV